MQLAKDRPAVFTPDIVTAVLQAYGLEPQGASTLAMAQGFTSQVIRVTGDGFDVVIRRHSQGHHRDQTDFALGYHAHLHAAGVPCPRLHRARSGAWTATCGEDLFSVQDFCRGEAFDAEVSTEEECRARRRQLGELLGRIHAAATPELAAAAPDRCRRSPARLFAPLPDVRSHMRWTRGGALARRAWILLNEPGGTGAELLAAVGLLDRARARLAGRLRPDDPRLAEVLPVHNDLHFENVLFERGEVCGVLDFDNVVVSSRAYDIGSTMAVVCARREHEQEFLEGFRAGGGGTLPDADLLRACALLRLAKSLHLQVTDYWWRRSLGPRQARRWIRRVSAMLEHELASS